MVFSRDGTPHHLSTILLRSVTAAEPVLRRLKAVLQFRSVPPCGRGFSRHKGLPIRLVGARNAGPAPPAHRLDEPTRLSLGCFPAVPASVSPGSVIVALAHHSKFLRCSLILAACHYGVVDVERYGTASSASYLIALSTGPAVRVI